jgi:hypothetical protein
MSSAPRRDYHQIIDQRAREGWRLVQIFAPSSVTSGGASGYYELIFERQVAQE